MSNNCSDHTNKSIRFERPSNKGNITIKMVNYHGDEVLKVYAV